MHERTVADNSLLEQRFTKLKADYENQLLQSDQLAGENSQRTMELRKKEEEVQRLKQEIVRGSKVRDGLQKRLRSVEEQKTDVENNRERLKQQINSLERGACVCTCIIVKCDALNDYFCPELESQRRQSDLEKRAYEDIMRERDMLSKVESCMHIFRKMLVACTALYMYATLDSGFEEV